MWEFIAFREFVNFDIWQFWHLGVSLFDILPFGHCIFIFSIFGCYGILGERRKDKKYREHGKILDRRTYPILLWKGWLCDIYSFCHVCI